MEAAGDLIWESGYGATSVDDICRKADVRKGSFYHFFNSKADLEVAVLEAQWAQNRQKLDGIFSPSVPPLKRLEKFFDHVNAGQAGMQTECGSVLGCPLFTIGSEVCAHEPAIREKVQEVLNTYVQYFESAIRDADAAGLINAPDAKAKARILFAYFQGTLTHARIENSLEPLRGLKDGAFALLGVNRLEPATA